MTRFLPPEGKVLFCSNTLVAFIEIVDNCSDVNRRDMEKGQFFSTGRGQLRS